MANVGRLRSVPQRHRNILENPYDGAGQLREHFAQSAILVYEEHLLTLESYFKNLVNSKYTVELHKESLS